jgi:parvulin-like peptidyl-prolyl isomerase
LASGTIARAAALIAGAALAACASSPAIVTVGNQTITKAQLEAKLYNSPAAVQALEQMIQSLALEQYAQRNGITVTDAEVAQKEAALAANYPKGTWEQAMAARGLTPDELRAAIRSQIILDEALGRNIIITDTQVRDYYARNRARFDRPPHAMTLAQAHDEIVAELRRQAEGPMVAPFLQKLLQNIKIEVHDPRFTSLSVGP